MPRFARSILPIMLVYVLLFSSTAYASQPRFVENKGQWHEKVKFRTETTAGYTYIDDEGLTFVLLEETFYEKLHNWFGQGTTPDFGRAHTVKMNFLGANLSNHATGLEDLGMTENYFLGSDTAKWARNVRSFNGVNYSEAYPGISIHYGYGSSNLKYEFIVGPGADPSQIRIGIDGGDSIFLDRENLIIQTSVGPMKELAPFAFQDIDGKITPVSCYFKLEGNEISYVFPHGYRSDLPLVIDPEISFSSYIGSASSSFGFTASYDEDGNLYSGAIVFGQYYPLVAGSYQVSFAGGSIDCGISKFNSTGTELIYSTYLGGAGNESPHSIVVHPETNTLYVLGSTSSTNFPLSTNAYQNNFLGGSEQSGAGYVYAGGSDIFVTKFTAAGNNLLASTFIGGSQNDGIGTGTALDFNYGDRFRGEIVVDEDGNAYVASVTASSNFPIVNGYAANFNATLSGVVFKLNANLSELIWSTYSGGSTVTSAFSLQLAADNSVYFTGGTTSGNIPTTAGAYQANPSGDVDGYIGHISADGGTLLACTYNGTGSFDQNYFVQIDLNGDIYVVGQSTGNYPQSGGVYGNPNSAQFVHKFSPDLSTSIWSTRVGSGSGNIDFSPSAFLVSNCGQIYISGWGGSLNPTGGSTNGLPVTSDAFQTTTDGDDFYIMVLDADASGLAFGTFFGGTSSSEHVDGGTSRFDKNGTVYQAVCAGCFGNDDFPTQPGVWSPTNGSTACNLAVLKFQLSSVNAVADFDAPDAVCPGESFDLVNLSEGADIFFWNMGDGTTSNQVDLSHVYSEPGTYTVGLSVEDSEGCLTPDSIFVTIEVLGEPNVDVNTPDPLCPDETVQLNATGADIWSWFPEEGLTAYDIANPIFIGDNTTNYTLTGSTACGTDQVELTVVVGNIDVSISENAEICPGESITLTASGGETYSWFPPSSLNLAEGSEVVASPVQTTNYTVAITTAEGCEVEESVLITLLPPAPTLTGRERYVSCNGEAVQLTVSGAEEYIWTPAVGLSDDQISDPVVNIDETTIYTVTGFNICGSEELEIEVIVGYIDINLITDSLVCYNDPFNVSAAGGQAYIWQPVELFSKPSAASTTAIIEGNTLLSVTGYDSLGCFEKETAYVRIYPRAEVRAGNDRVINYGDDVNLESFSIYPIVWDYSPYLSCLNCNYPRAFPLETTTFYANITSDDGCPEVDSVTVFVRGNIYVPNAFTPDGDGLNDLFKAQGVDITEFKMEIFNRWGELVFISEDIDHGWNGSFLGDGYYCSPDLYQYRIVAREHKGDVFELEGHVILIR